METKQQAANTTAVGRARATNRGLGKNSPFKKNAPALGVEPTDRDITVTADVDAERLVEEEEQAANTIAVGARTLATNRGLRKNSPFITNSPVRCVEPTVRDITDIEDAYVERLVEDEKDEIHDKPMVVATAVTREDMEADILRQIMKDAVVGEVVPEPPPAFPHPHQAAPKAPTLCGFSRREMICAVLAVAIPLCIGASVIGAVVGLSRSMVGDTKNADPTQAPGIILIPQNSTTSPSSQNITFADPTQAPDATNPTEAPGIILIPQNSTTSPSSQNITFADPTQAPDATNPTQAPGIILIPQNSTTSPSGDAKNPDPTQDLADTNSYWLCLVPDPINLIYDSNFLKGYVGIWWGHTAGDAGWACNNWNAACSGKCFARHLKESHWDCINYTGNYRASVDIWWGHRSADAVWACYEWHYPQGPRADCCALLGISCHPIVDTRCNASFQFYRDDNGTEYIY